MTDPAVETLDRNFLDADLGPGEPGASWAVPLFEAQALSRHLDFAARWLQERGAGKYTIASAGHESNAAVAAALRPTDPALLHYRSGAFYVLRATQAARDPVPDVLLGVVASSDEPIAGGRHKVFGHADLAVIPQTSTIGSHLPRALGVAFSVGRSPAWPDDAVVVCGFGDASVNHSTVTGAVNAAGWYVHQGHPVPLLLVCEDNGLGISVPTPPGWVEAAYGHRPGVRYLAADGADPVATRAAAGEAARYVREERKPAFLHLLVVRYLGHAGSDVESAYRPPPEIAADLARDPLVATGRLLGPAAREIYEGARERVVAAAEDVIGRRRLTSAAEVMAPLARHSPDRVAEVASRTAPEERRRAVFGKRLPEEEGPLTLALAVNRALVDLALVHEGLLVFGEDVGRKGGVYGVTRGLQAKLGGERVFDTLLDEQTILGLALGTGLSGLLPVPEIQYLAYLHNAEDQLRGEAATLQFFSRGRYRNPMVVRVAGYGYQKGFGGHFHNDNAVAVLRDVPGLVVASPSRADDAAAMLRTCAAAAAVDGRVCVFLEPIALYHSRDVAAPYGPGAHVPVGSARTHGNGADLTIVTFANGVPMSLRVADRLAEEGIGARVVDLRWLVPLPAEDVLREAEATGRVLVVDETRRSGGVSEAVVTALVDGGFGGRIARVASADSFVPLGDAAETVLVSEDDVLGAARKLL